MGNPLPESALTLCQSRLSIWYLSANCAMCLILLPFSEKWARVFIDQEGLLYCIAYFCQLRLVKIVGCWYFSTSLLVPISKKNASVSIKLYILWDYGGIPPTITTYIYIYLGMTSTVLYPVFLQRIFKHFWHNACSLHPTIFNKGKLSSWHFSRVNWVLNKRLYRGTCWLYLLLMFLFFWF
jgi:hypothetical protein